MRFDHKQKKKVENQSIVRESEFQYKCTSNIVRVEKWESVILRFVKISHKRYVNFRRGARGGWGREGAGRAR